MTKISLLLAIGLSACVVGGGSTPPEDPPGPPPTTTTTTTTGSGGNPGPGSGSGSGSGSNVGSGSCEQEQEANDSEAQATPATSTTNTLDLCGALSSGSDVDYFRFSLTQPATLTISVAATYDAQGTVIAPDGGSAQTGAGGGPGGGQGGSATISGPAGTYYVRLESSGGMQQSYTATVTAN